MAKIKGLLKKLKEFENITNILGQPLQYWEMGLSFCYIPRCQTPPLDATHLITFEAATIWSLKLENIKGIWQKLKETEKLTKY